MGFINGAYDVSRTFKLRAMTTTELQIHRGYLSDLNKAHDLILQLTYFAAQNKGMQAKLEAATNNLEDVINEFEQGIKKKELELCYKQ